jgi:hypothetical protein
MRNIKLLECCLFVDDERYLRSLANDIEEGKRTVSDVKQLEENGTPGRGKRTKFRKSVSYESDAEVKSRFTLMLFYVLIVNLCVTKYR